jgi:hypothetical protein
MFRTKFRKKNQLHIMVTIIMDTIPKKSTSSKLNAIYKIEHPADSKKT